MEQELKCPLCEEKIYSYLGEGCKMCGMELQEMDIDFCSEGCKKKYAQINNKGGKTK